MLHHTHLLFLPSSSKPEDQRKEVLINHLLSIKLIVSRVQIGLKNHLFAYGHI